MPALASGAPSDRPRVVGGTPVAAGAWLDAAAVYSNDELFCTGVLIAPQVILTAGHCLLAVITHVELGANRLGVPGTVYGVARQIAYPRWENTFDLGLLLLDRPSPLPPRLIASGCASEQYLVEGAPVTIVGWGAVDAEGRVSTPELLEADTRITDASCRDTAAGCMPEAQPRGELGAGGEGIDSCNGDSGGPLYLRTERGDFLAGITSRGYETNTLPCSQGGIYVRPDAVLEWIERTAGEPLPRPVCNAAPEPAVQTLELTVGGSAELVLDPLDPDAGDTHSYVIATAPLHGSAVIRSDGTLEYTAAADYVGTDSLVVDITDNGTPPITGAARIEVVIRDAGGCSATAAPGGTWLLALMALGLGRRRG